MSDSRIGLGSGGFATTAANGEGSSRRGEDLVVTEQDSERGGMDYAGGACGHWADALPCAPLLRWRRRRRAAVRSLAHRGIKSNQSTGGAGQQRSGQPARRWPARARCCWEQEEGAPGDVQQVRLFLPQPGARHAALGAGGLGCSRRAAGDPNLPNTGTLSPPCLGPTTAS